jgi:hypothetical protein
MPHWSGSSGLSNCKDDSAAKRDLEAKQSLNKNQELSAPMLAGAGSKCYAKLTRLAKHPILSFTAALWAQ